MIACPIELIPFSSLAFIGNRWVSEIAQDSVAWIFCMGWWLGVGFSKYMNSQTTWMALAQSTNPEIKFKPNNPRGAFVSNKECTKVIDQPAS